MILPLLMILVIGALLGLRGRKIRLAGGLLVAALLIFLAVGSGIVATLLLGATEVRSTRNIANWTNHTSIVLLGAGTSKVADAAQPQVPFFGYSRVATAARAYFACKSQQPDCKIVVSGGDPQHHGATEAHVYAAALAALRVPAADLVLEPTSKNTFQNAVESTKLVAKDRALVIVASGFQLRRALLYFRHFRESVDGIASDTLDVEIGLVPSSMNFLTTDVLLHEQIGIARYHLYNAFGWNAPKIQPAL